MACKPWKSGLFQREDPIPDGGSWTTDAGAVDSGTQIDFRGRGICENLPGTNCTSWTTIQHRKDGGAWTNSFYDKFQDVQLQFQQPIDWFYPYHKPIGAGTWEYRLWYQYDGSDYYSNTITITVSEVVAWTETEPGGTTGSESTPGGTSATETATAGTTGSETAPAGTTATETAPAGTSATETEPAGTTATEVVTSGGDWSETTAIGVTATEVETAGTTATEVVTSGGSWTEPETTGLDPDISLDVWAEEESNNG
jgi:hypothetical protein